MDLLRLFAIFHNTWNCLRNIIEVQKQRSEDINKELVALRRRRRVILQRLLSKNRRAGRRTRCWRHIELRNEDTRGNFWENTVPLYNDDRFQQKFRLSRTSFCDLVAKLTPALVKQDTIMRNAISVDKRVAVAIYALKSNADMWTIADLFGIGRSTVSYLLHEFCAAVNTVLYEDSVQFPATAAARNEVARGFQNRWQFPGCIGALDGSHIPISAPAYCPADYYNYKGYHSIVLLALVDYNYKFVYTNIGRPGRANDATVFADSGLHTFMTTNLDDAEDQEHHIIGDAAFPLMPWLMVPYVIHLNMPLSDHNFNYRLSSARMVVENAFGRLKGRWRILLKKSDFSVQNMKEIIKTCVVLHNICEDNKDTFFPHWLLIVNTSNKNLPQPTHIYNQRRAGQLAKAKRDLIARQLCSDGLSVVM